jgi:hypothetical protein
MHVMIETTILGKQNAIETLHLEPRSSPTARKVIAAAIVTFLALAVFV